MKTTEYRDITTLKHAKSIVSKYARLFHKRPLTSEERQELAYWESRVEDEYKKPVKPFPIACNMGCRPEVGSLDSDCDLHGWGTNLSGRE